MHWRRKWQPPPVFLPGESQGPGSLVAAVYGVAQSRTRLKRHSSSSSTYIVALKSVLQLRSNISLSELLGAVIQKLNFHWEKSSKEPWALVVLT